MGIGRQFGDFVALCLQILHIFYFSCVDSLSVYEILHVKVLLIIGVNGLHGHALYPFLDPNM